MAPWGWQATTCHQPCVMEPLPRDPVSPRWPLGVRPGTGTGSRDTETIYGRDKGRLCWPRKASVSLPCRLVTVTSVRWCGRDGAAMGLVWGQGWAQSREERLTVSASWETPRPSHCPGPQWALYLGSPAALWGWGSRHGGRPTTRAQPLSEEGVCDRGHACETARSKWVSQAPRWAPRSPSLETDVGEPGGGITCCIAVKGQSHPPACSLNLDGAHRDGGLCPRRPREGGGHRAGPAAPGPAVGQGVLRCLLGRPPTWPWGSSDQPLCLLSVCSPNWSCAAQPAWAPSVPPQDGARAEGLGPRPAQPRAFPGPSRPLGLPAGPTVRTLPPILLAVVTVMPGPALS